MSRLVRSPLARLRARGGFERALDAAGELGVSRIYVLELEEGKGNPSPALVERMASAYKCSRAAILKAVRSAQLELTRRRLKQLKDA